MFVSQGSPEKQPVFYTQNRGWKGEERQHLVGFEALAHTAMEAGRSKIGRADGRLETRVKSCSSGLSLF